MRLKQNSTSAIVVKKTWANQQAIKLFLRDRPLDEIQSPDDSYVIFARALDDTDERGLWIELNTSAHEKDPAVELQALLIPWHAVQAVVVAENFTPAMEEARKLGFH
ncbi:MAG: hypothetical protein WAL71_13845 [Terriglobales bacterium]|jgi:hypothetical protein